ncbi:MAG: synthase subunit [Anaerocolumna sp.]|nr:synthase subunit [Anaerocolumna sp.]
MCNSVFFLIKNVVFLAATTDEMNNRIFGLDPQLLADSSLLALSVFVLFVALSYLLFNPARDLLNKRKDKIKADMDASISDKATAEQLKVEYAAKLRAADREIDELLSNARKKAQIREAEIINEAKIQANLMIERAYKEIELERNKVKDEVKNEMITVASYMASKIIEVSMDKTIQTRLIENALKEMGEKTWLN